MVLIDISKVLSNDLEIWYLFFDISNCSGQIYDTYSNNKLWLALLDEILLHRRIELWGEGHRFLDLKRTNAPLNRNGANHIASVVLLYDVAPGDVRWEFLIPRREINSNTAIVQNPL